ncbi:MAG: hypothetical protein JWO68_3055 [Actinomycetia bacterium]|nr:hypothetical protein [Actinomycetes bacterium]
MNRLLRGAVLGAAAGAAGTTALDAVTYLDMAVRGRPASTTPARTVETLSERVGVPVPGEGGTGDNRLAGLGALTGYAAGVGMGAVLGVARAAGLRPGALVASGLALVGTNGPMTVLGVTDPRTWTAVDWVSDIVPHLAYGAVTAAVLDRLT